METSAVAIGTQRRPQIDGLRAATMVSVLYVHFWQAGALAENVRVSLFFVISGFLITYILLRAKRAGGKILFWNFYARRFLRLFPPIIMATTLAYLLDMDGFRSSFIWHLFQLSNVYYSFAQTQHPWVMGHLWSLNVLEQFYLIIPILVFFNSEKNIRIYAALLWVLAIFLRVNALNLGIISWMVKIILPFDPIVLGIFAATIIHYEPVSSFIKSKTVITCSIVLILSPLFLWEDYGSSESYRILIQPALCALVAGAFLGYKGIPGHVLSSRLMGFLSKISYGVYIYHIPIWWLIGERYREFYQEGPLTFLVLSAVTLLVATVSWFAVEEPLSRLKRYFPTSVKQNPQLASQAADIPLASA